MLFDSNLVDTKYIRRGYSGFLNNRNTHNMLCVFSKTIELSSDQDAVESGIYRNLMDRFLETEQEFIGLANGDLVNFYIDYLSYKADDVLYSTNAWKPDTNEGV